jgi:hypothetical protein
MRTILMVKATIFLSFCFVQNSNGGSCNEQLFKIGVIKGSQGYSCVYENYGNLNEGYFQKNSVYLTAGHYYEMFAVCDNDCDDIDLKMYDLRGNLISKDETDDDIPKLTCIVYNSGYFIVKVNMCDCSNEPCKYGLAVFGK